MGPRGAYLKCITQVLNHVHEELLHTTKCLCSPYAPLMGPSREGLLEVHYTGSEPSSRGTLVHFTGSEPCPWGTLVHNQVHFSWAPSWMGLFGVQFTGSEPAPSGTLVHHQVFVFPLYSSHGPPPGRAYLKGISQVLNHVHGELLYTTKCLSRSRIPEIPGRCLEPQAKVWGPL